MSDPTTPHLGLTLPTVGADSDHWGDLLNADLGLIDGLFANTGTTPLGAAALLPASDPRFMSTGMIVMWSGSVVSIPTGWLLCDGTNSTPDLRDRFLVGAGNAYAVGATGGSTSQTPAITVAGHALSLGEMPSHDHGFSDGGHSHGSSVDDHSHGIRIPETDNNQVYTHTGAGFGLGGGGSFTGFSPGTLNTTVGINSGGVSANVQSAGANISFSAQGGNAAHGHPGSTSSAIDVRPPYYALCFIMKA